jgi:hypothetical protein
MPEPKDDTAFLTEKDDPKVIEFAKTLGLDKTKDQLAQEEAAKEADLAVKTDKLFKDIADDQNFQRLKAEREDKGVLGNTADLAIDAVQGLYEGVVADPIENLGIGKAVYNQQQIDAGDVGSGIPESELAASSDVGSLLKNTTKFAGGFLGLGKFFKLAKGANLALRTGRIVALSGATQTLSFDPYEERLSNFIAENPALDVPIANALAADDKDPSWKAHLKAFVEGAGLGLAGEGIVGVVGLMKQGRAIRALKGDEAAAEFMAENIEQIEPSSQAEVTKAAEPASSLKIQDPQAVAGPKNIELTPEQVLQIRDGFVTALKEGKPIEKLSGLNIDHLLLEDAPFQLMEQVSKILEEPIAKLKANGQTLEGIFQNADNAAADPLLVLAKGRRQAQEAPKWSADQTAMRIITATYTDAAGELGLLNDAKAAAGTITEADDLKLLAMLVRQAQTQADTEAIVSGHARATSANRIDVLGSNNVADQLDALTPKIDPIAPAVKDTKEILKDILSQPDGSFRLRQLSKVVAGVKDNPKGMSMVARALNSGLQLHNNLWMNAILSRPVSVIRDTIGNVTNTFAPPIEKMIGGLARRNEQAVLEGARTLYTLGESALEALQMAKMAFDNNIAFLDPGNQFTQAEKVMLSAIPGESLIANGIRSLGTIAELPTRLRIGTDEFFKQINARALIRARATKMAYDAKIPKNEIKGYVQRVLDQAISDQNGKSLSDTATKYAQETTFTSQLNPDSLIGAYENLVNQHPIMRVVTPFVRTPTNLYKWSWHRTPGLNFLSKEYRDAWSAGGVSRAQAEGKLATGAVLWTSAIYLAHNNLITGAGPKDPDQNKLWRQAGNQPYSVTLPSGDKVSYLGLDPLVSTFYGLSADYHENAGQMTDDGRMSVGGAMLLAATKNITNKSMLQGISQFADLLTKADTNQNKWDRFWRARVASYVPGGLKDISRALPHDATFHTDDPYFKEVNSVMDAVLAKSPFSNYAADYRNMFGERVLIPAGLGEDTISPFATTKDNPDKVTQELAKYPQGFNRPSPQLSENVRLTSKQYSDRLSELETYTIGGKTLKEELSEVINSDSYKNASDNYTTRFNGISEKKMLLVNRIQKFYEDTEHSYLKKNPDIRAKVEADKKARADVLRNGIQAAPEDPLQLLNKYKK